MATSSSPRRPRPNSYHQGLSLSALSPKSSAASKNSLATSPSKGRGVGSPTLALKIPPKVDRSWRRSASPGARSSASGSSTGSSDSLPSRRATATLRKLAQMRHEDKLVDLALIFHRAEIRCHRVVLAASSPYFRDMLSVPSHLTKFDSIELKGVDQLVFEALVDYSYTSTIRIGNDRVKTLLEAANMFQFQSVIDACVDHLKKSRRTLRQRSTSRQRSDNGKSPSSGGSPRSESPRSTPVHSPHSDSPLASTPSPLLSSSKDEPYKIFDDRGMDVSRRLQKVGGNEEGDTDVAPQYTRSISTGSEGYRTSSTGSDPLNDPSSTYFVWQDMRHASRTIREMVKLRKDAGLTDVVLRTQTRDFHCHRLLLESSSPYLSRVISRDLDGTNVMDVHIKNASADVLQKLISFMYTGRVAVSERDARQVYKVAKRFKLEDACRACVAVDPTLALEVADLLNESLTDNVLSGAMNSVHVADLQS